MTVNELVISLLGLLNQGKIHGEDTVCVAMIDSTGHYGTFLTDIGGGIDGNGDHCVYLGGKL